MPTFVMETPSESRHRYGHRNCARPVPADCRSGLLAFDRLRRCRLLVSLALARREDSMTFLFELNQSVATTDGKNGVVVSLGAGIHYVEPWYYVRAYGEREEQLYYQSQLIPHQEP